MALVDIIAAIRREMSPAEVAAALLILINVWLVARRSIWNYAFGLVGVAIYGWVFFGAKLYSDALLQIFFFFVQFYGLYQWRRSEAERGEVAVEMLSTGARAGWAAGIVVATLAWGTLMHRYTDAALPYWDGAVAMMSVAAQFLLSDRKLENWWLWIVADVLSIGLYLTKALWVTAGLYGLLLGIATWGLFDWLRASRARATPA